MYLKRCIEHLLESIEDDFATIYKQIERMTAKLPVTPATSRTAIAQQNWNNVLSEDREEYCRQAIAIPLIERFLQKIKFRFIVFVFYSCC